VFTERVKLIVMVSEKGKDHPHTSHSTSIVVDATKRLLVMPSGRVFFAQFN
jgi:hypothetical protein